MKSTLSLFALLSYAIFSVDAAKEEKEVHPYDFKIEYLKAKHNLGYLKAHKAPAQHFKRFAQQEDPSPDDSEITFLPPPWTPSSDLDSPYPLSGVTPWDDSGRSQTLDNEPSIQLWRTCPRLNLNCKKCPRDERCRRPSQPWWDPTNIHDVESALAGPPLVTSENRKDTCPLATCSTSDPFMACGENSKCVRNHCVCNRGFKSSATGETPVVRGFDGLQAVTVWVDPQWGCDVPCDDLSCKEVEQVEACFGGVEVPDSTYGAESTGVSWEQEQWGEPGDGDQLDTAGTGGGAIQVLGADVETGGDFVAVVAVMGMVGEAN
jgi:hypothetical protein